MSDTFTPRVQGGLDNGSYTQVGRSVVGWATLVAVLAAFTLIAAACGDDDEPAPAPAPAPTAPAVDTAALEAAQADAEAALAEASAAADAAAEAEAALEAALAEALAAAEGQVDAGGCGCARGSAAGGPGLKPRRPRLLLWQTPRRPRQPLRQPKRPRLRQPRLRLPAEAAAAGPTDPCGGENETSTITIMMDWLAYWSWAATGSGRRPGLLRPGRHQGGHHRSTFGR